MIDGAVPCHNCGSLELDYSFGAMFGCASIFCTKCGCGGATSDTEPKEPDQEIRKRQAFELWNSGMIEKTKWDHLGGERFYPPIQFPKKGGLACPIK